MPNSQSAFAEQLAGIRRQLIEATGGSGEEEAALLLLAVWEKYPTVKDLRIPQLSALAEVSPEDVIKGLATLVGGVGAIEVGYLFLDGGQSVLLGGIEIAQAGKDGFLVHPLTGETLIDWEARVVPVFNLSSRL